MRPIVINQHYIPRSYLKNFGFLVNHKKRKWSLYAMENGGEIERRTTDNICAVDYLYDLPLVSGEDRQFLEHAYEEHADRHFKEITNFVTDDLNLRLSLELREKILKSCLSLYYRTPKFVELDQQALESIQNLPEPEQEAAWKIKKTQLLEQSVKNFERLYLEKRDCGISINKAVREWEFISGDNPVIIRNKKGELDDVLSRENIIHIPLTPRYLVTILPANESSLHKSFNRIFYDDDSVMSINYDIERLHQKYLLGTKVSLEYYVKNSPEYKAPAPPDHPKILRVKRVEAAVTTLVQVLIRNNGKITKEVKDYFNWCWINIDGFKDDPNSQEVKNIIDGHC